MRRRPRRLRLPRVLLEGISGWSRLPDYSIPGFPRPYAGFHAFYRASHVN